MTLFFLSFLAGVLTILAPCVLPLLPVIIGSSVGNKNKLRPYLIILGLIISITLFTILLKASTLLISVEPVFWSTISGSLVLVFGFIYLFPEIWDSISLKFKFSSKSDNLLEKASESSKENWFGSLLIGAALGPVFASCSPTYSLIVATVLPVDLIKGIGYILVYSFGLGIVMLAISLLGRGFVKKLNLLANPNGIFKKVLGVIFIIIGIAVISGFDKVIETNILNSGFFDITRIEKQILENSIPESK